MAPVDGSVVSIALPVITRDLHTTLPVSEWVSMAYLLAISSLLLSWGRLGDMVGHRAVYLSGFAIFTGGSALCAAASSIGWLIAFRVLQAIGGGMMMAAGPAIITEAFPADERGRALGLNAVAVAAGLSIGPVLGGFLVRSYGWRAIFTINIPIGLAGIAWAARVLRRPRRVVPERFDFAGAVLVFGGLFLILVALSQGEAWGWTSMGTIASSAGGIVLLVAFASVERRVTTPMVRLDLFRDRTFALANLAGLTNHLAMSSVTFLLPFYLQDLRGIPPDQAGLVMLGMPMVLILVAPLAGYLSDRFGTRWLATGGMTLLAVAAAQMSFLDGGAPVSRLFWGLAAMGLGSAVFQTPNNSTIMGAVPPRRLGIASGMLASMRNIGMVLGVALSGAVFTSVAGISIGGSVRSPVSFMAGLRAAMLAGAAVAAAGAVASAATLPARRAANGPGRPQGSRRPARAPKEGGAEHDVKTVRDVAESALPETDGQQREGDGR